ncbi:MAG TPA: LuxR C-terminal-related transcriptional regulator [Gemmatimonadales bacterium]|nr:LuxR C-terminal-related transcriptional regulator [Gemmatimonadales bacterium]
MSPLEWGSRDAWLAESVQRVREVCGVPGRELPADSIGGLEALLHVPNDHPGWLWAALEGPEGGLRDVRWSPTVEGSEAWLVVVSLRCALIAGLATLHRLRAWRSTLGQAFDDVETGMAIFGNEGRREVARNERLNELLQEELARDRLLDHISRQAAQAASSERQREDAQELELPGGFYRLSASRVAAGTLLTEPGVLVLVDRLTAALPTTQELRVTFGLRGREPQVALLAAEGLSNAVIAQRLRLSAHTVRHYLERVLDRLGLHTRKALALHLMGGGGERPQLPSRRPAP